MGEPLHHHPPGRVGERPEHEIERCVLVKHMIKYNVATSLSTVPGRRAVRRQLAFADVFGERGGALEFDACLGQAARLVEQAAAHVTGV